MTGKKLPKKVFIRWMETGDGESWLNADPKSSEIVELGEIVTVGVYELKNTVRLRNATRIVE